MIKGQIDPRTLIILLVVLLAILILTSRPDILNEITGLFKI